MGTTISTLHRGSAKRCEQQSGTCAFQMGTCVRVYLIQNNIVEVDSTKYRVLAVLASYNNCVKQTYNTCSVHTRVCSTIYGLT